MGTGRARWASTDLPDQRGVVAVVTGASSGLGRAAAARLAAAGAHVVLACRDSRGAAAALAEVTAGAVGPAPELVALDLADLASVAAAAAEIGRRVDRVDLLVNNAGVMAVPPMLTADGFDLQFGTNHLGHFALTGRVLPLLLAAAGARVVTVTSVAAARGTLSLSDLQSKRAYDPWVAYSRSKQANALFALELHRRTGGGRWGPESLAAHPGWAATSLVANGPGRFAGPGATAVYAATRLVAAPAGHGARSLLRAGTDAALASGTFVAPRGPAHLWGRPAPVRPPAAVTDPALAAGLWAASESLTGVAFPLPAGPKR